jgi:hypothetical protein
METEHGMKLGQTSGRRVRRSREQWQSLVARYESGSLSAKQFCQQEDISQPSLWRWRALLSGGRPGGLGDVVEQAPRGPFIDAGVLGLDRNDGGRLELKLELGGGLVLHLVRG